MAVLDRLPVRRVRWLPILMTLLAGPVVAVGFAYAWSIAAAVDSARWCRAAFLLGADVARERRARVG